MANNVGKQQMQLGFSVDKSGLETLKSQLQRISDAAQRAGSGVDEGLQKAAETAKTLDNILDKSFNHSLGSLNVSKFNQDLNKVGLSINDIRKNLSKAGSQGVEAFNQMQQTIIGTHLKIKETNKTLDRLFTTFGNTFRYTVSTKVLNTLVGSIESAYSFAKNLDTSLNDIRIVTSKSADEMQRFADIANTAAKSLGASTLDYTNAALIYYQQGLSDEEVQARTETTLKAANVTGQTGAQVSEQLTAVQNGYKVTAEETELYMDKLAAVAASTAADLEELSTGMSKVASAANAMGVDFDDLNAQIATIVSVTRQAPESVGTALKTIYARLGDLKVDGVDEFGTKLGEVSSQLQTMGIDILDVNGDMRDMTSVMTEVAEKQNTWTSAQQQAAAVAMAGKRQYNNLVALFENQDMYSGALETSVNAMGTLQKQQDIYMESTEAHLTNLKTNQEDFYNDLMNPKDLNYGIELLSNLVQVLDKFVESTGGGLGTLAAFGAMLSKVFNQQISNSIIQMSNNISAYKDNLAKINLRMESIGVGSEDFEKKATDQQRAQKANLDAQMEFAEFIQENQTGIASSEDFNKLVDLQKELGKSAEEQFLIRKEYVNILGEERATTEEIERIRTANLSTIIDERDAARDSYNDQIKKVKEEEKDVQLKEKKLEAIKTEITDQTKLEELKEKIAKFDLDNRNKSDSKKIEEFKNELSQINIESENAVSKVLTLQKNITEELKNQVEEEKNKLEINEDEIKNIETKIDQETQIINQLEKAKEEGLKNKTEKGNITKAIKGSDLSKEEKKSLLILKDKLKVNENNEVVLKEMLDIVNKIVIKDNEDIKKLQDQIKEHQKEKDILDKQLFTLENIFKIYNEEGSKESQILKIKQELLSIAIELGYKEDSRTIQAINEAETEEQIFNVKQLILDSLKSSLEEEEDVLAKLEEELGIQERILENKKKQTEEDEKQADLENNRKANEDIIKRNKLISDRTTLLTNSLGLMTTSLTSVDSVLNTITDDTVELEDKVSQIALTASYSLPMIISSVEKLIGITGGPWVLAGIAIATVLKTVLTLLDNELEKIEKNRQAREEEQKTFRKRQEEIKKEYNEQKELFNSYLILYNQYERGIATKEDLSKKTEELTDFLTKEGIAVAELTGNYEELANQIKEKEKARRDEQISQLETDIKEQKQKIMKSGEFTLNLEKVEDLFEQVTFGSEGIKDSDKTLKKYFNILEDNGEFILTFNENLDAADFKIEEFYKALDKVNSYLEKQGKSPIDTTSFSQYLSNLYNLSKEKEDLKYENMVFDRYQNINPNDFSKYLDLFQNSMEEVSKGFFYKDKSSQEIFDRVQDFFEKAGADTKYQNRIMGLSSIADSLGVSIDKILESKIAELPQEKIIALLSTSLPKLENEDELQQQIVDELSNYLLAGAEAFTKQNAEKAYEESTSLMSGLQSGKINISNIEENEEYNNLIKRLETIKEYYPEIAAQSEMLSRTQMVGTEEYLEALEEVQDKMYEFNKAQTMDSAETNIAQVVDLIDSLDVDNLFNTDELETFRDELNDIFNDEYSITVQVHSEAEQEFESITNAFDQLEKSASKIGENFVISADDIRELGNAFPGILENMTYLADGSIQLNEQMVHSAMAAAEAEAQADAEKTVEKLEHQAIELKAKKQNYETLAQDAYNLANSEGKSATEVGKLKEKLSNDLTVLQETNSTEVTNQELGDLEAVANSSLDNYGVIYANGDSAYRGLASSSVASARVQIQSMNAVSNQSLDELDAIDSNYSATYNYQGSSGTNKARETIEHAYRALDDETTDWQSIGQAFEELAKSTGKQLDDIYAMIAQVGGTSFDLDKLLGNIASGKGANPKSGGGGKDKSKDKKEYEDEFDRYQEIKKAIEAVDRAISKLEKDQSKLYGKELINSLKQENELLEQQAANYETLYEMQQQEAEELRAQLGTMGVMFDASGAIMNYAAATSAALAAYSAAIEQYNAGLIDETTLGVYEKAYENFKKLLERYDSLYYKEMQDTQDKLDELRRKELENNLKAWEIELQIKLDKEQAIRDQNDFLKEIKQDFRKVQKDFTIDVEFDKDNFYSYMNDINNTLAAIKQVEAEIQKIMNGEGSDMFESLSQAQEKLKELQQKLLEQGKSLYELYKAIWDAYISAMDQVKEQFDELMNRYDRLGKKLDFAKQLTELIYGDKAYKEMNKYYEAQSKLINSQIDSLQKQKDFWQSKFDESYQLALDTGADVDLNDFTTQTKGMKKAYDNMAEAQENINDLVLEGVKILQEKYLNSINEIADAMDKSFQGSSGFEGVKQNWEFMQRKADEFLDDVQKMGNIQLFENKILMDIDNTSSLKAQQKLNKFREEEIAALKEKQNFTEYDLELAEARYQIALKEIALEDAQMNKTSMKLVRNEQGNQTYQYVADEDEIAEKQNDLLQATMDYYEKSNEAYEHSMDLYMTLYEEYSQKLVEIMSDTTLSAEERDQKLLELEEMYQPMMAAVAENAELYKQEAMVATAAVFKEICEEDAENYQYLTEEQKRLVEEVKNAGIEDFGELRKAIIEGYYPDLAKAAADAFKETNINSQTLAADIIRQQATDPNGVKNMINGAIGEMKKALQDYEKELDNLQKLAGIDFGNIGGYIDIVIGEIDDMDGRTEDMVDNASELLDKLRQILEDVAKAWEDIIDKIFAAQEEMQRYIDLEREAQSNIPGGGNNSGGGGGSSGGGGTGGGGDNPGGPNNPGTKKRASDDGYSLGSDSEGQKIQKNRKIVIGKRAEDIQDGETIHEQATKWAKSKGYDEFRTGGYTGEQGNSGRLAVLHQKELVLNEDDTENFLKGVSLLRDMSGTSGSITNAIMSAIGKTIMNLSNYGTKLNIPNTTSSDSESSDNVFNITAEFPNATNVDDIRQAILSLPNIASQFIGRR